jgi:hypothetical protein
MNSYSTQKLKQLTEKYENILNNHINISNNNINISNNMLSEIIINGNNINLEKIKLDLINYIKTSVKNKTNNLCFITPYLLYRDEINNNNIYNTLLISLFNEEEVNKTKVNISRSDNTFKKEVKQLYNTCQVSGCHISCCDVAHILEFKDCTTNIDRYNKYNGLLLKGDIHRYWDLGYIKLNFDNNYDNNNYDNNNYDNCLIYFTINKDKINQQLDSHNLLFNVIDELKLNDENEKCYLNFHKEYFNAYKYYITRRNDYL